MQLAPITAVARPPSSGWQWLRFTQPALPDTGESHVISLYPGWWEITVEWPQTATLRLYDTTDGSISYSLPNVEEERATRIFRKQFAGDSTRIQMESSVSTANVGKEFWVIARPM